MVALAVPCLLDERYAKATIKDGGGTETDAAVRVQFASDFGVDDDTAEAFWGVIRNCFLHQGRDMMKSGGAKKVKGWVMSEKNTVPVELDIGGPAQELGVHRAESLIS